MATLGGGCTKRIGGRAGVSGMNTGSVREGVSGGMTICMDGGAVVTMGVYGFQLALYSCEKFVQVFMDHVDSEYRSCHKKILLIDLIRVQGEGLKQVR